MRITTLSPARRMLAARHTTISLGLGIISLLLGSLPSLAQAPTTTPSSGFFSGGFDTNVGTNPQRVALGDVDKDGDLDLLTLSSSTVSVRLNTGTSPNFSTGFEVPIGASAQGLAVGDLDGDGDLDLAIANNVSAAGLGFTLKLNNGNNTFTTSPSGVMNPSLNSVAVGDVDGDGDLDLAVGGTETSSVSVWLNNGRAVFSSPRSTTTVYGNQEVTLGDVDKDGDLDLLVATSTNGSRTVSVRLNTNGTFGGGQNVGVGRDPRSVALGDLDGDGALDFVAANGDDNSVSVRLNNGSATFSASQEVGVGSVPNSVAVGDVDGDGDLDFVAANSGGTTVSVCLNNGSGRFIYANNQLVATGTRPYSVALGDVDGDGDLDLATANIGSATASIRLNQNQALLLPTITSLSPTSSAVGSSVVITGANFLNVKEVTFNGVSVPAANLVPNSLTQLTVIVPPGASTGPVVVVTTAGASNGTLLTIGASAQVIAVMPTRNASAAPRTTSVAATFDQPLSTAAATLGAIRVFGSQAGGKKAGNATVSGNTLTFDPSADFKPGEKVQATITPQAQSTTGAAAKPHVFQFTAATSPSSGVFSGGSEVSTAAGAVTTAVGDIDGDGDLDLVATISSIPDRVNVRLNDGSGSFSGSQEVAVGSATSSIVLGDVDGDGDLDFVTGNASTASVRLNNGSGVFAGGQEVAINGTGNKASLGDMDGDGDLDLVASDGVHFNNGSGTFSGQNIAASNATSLVLGDVDSDGDLDVVSVLYGTTGLASVAVSVQLNNGAGGLSAGQVLPEGTGTYSDVALGDLDGDGDLDVLTIVSFNNAVSVRLNNGNGTFGDSRQVLLTAQPQDLEVSDVDGDGDLDLLTSPFNGTTVSVRLNNGAGLFGNGQDLSFASALQSLTTGDINGDGAPDLLVANLTAFRTPGRISVRLNQPTTSPLTVTALAPRRNRLGAPRTGPITATFSQSLSNTAATLGALKIFSAQAGGQKAGAATVNGNTLSVNPTAAFKPGETVFATVTTAVQGSGGQTLGAGQVYQFTAATSRSRETSYFSGFYDGSDLAAGVTEAGVVVAGVVTGDVDGDGDLDLVSAKGVQLNNGTAGFAPGAPIIISGTPRGLVLGDLDGDGDLDVVVVSNTGTGVVQLRVNNGQGSFSGTQQVSVGADPSAVALADVDADGDLDLLTANYSSNSVSVRLNNGQGSFSGGSEVAVGAQPVSLAVGDVDNDGDLDLLTPSFSGTTVSVRLNNGTGTFSGSQEVAVGFNPHSVVLGDLDGDGDLDLVTTNYNDYTPNYINSSTVSVRLNTGSGTFTGTQNQLIPWRGLVSAVLGDVDSDGDLDLAVASENDYGNENSTVIIRLNTGGGSFSFWQNVTVGRGVGSLAFGDLDGDGDVDLVTGNGADGTASVRLNRLYAERSAAVLQTATSASASALSLFPNPSTGHFTLSYTAAQPQPATLTLTDRLGRVVLQQRLSLQAGVNSLPVEAPASAAGLYQLTLRTATGQAHQQKIVIQP
ncbi:beta strand repeat-containing protein [Hymenobacter sp. GOD-10R]|uniref:beta strand repeat-containing protein n=1 Tax=Hymenobacter sp. GOD-10R TaxID=3093922 RepID=UPI002D79EDBC|nr:FG-GAP-like repeat-containing protein [Hymenobacter sp. GOD-10R]WRQ28438.1 FG-GAP-like repeat-containing protein [Hymenobacter sp. GOD-10R]